MAVNPGRFRRIAGCAALACLLANLFVGIHQVRADEARTTVETGAAWVAHALRVADVAPNTAVDLTVYLNARGGEAALDAAALAASTPGTPTYRRFLTVDQFRARYQPTDAAVAAVSGWLSSTGLRVTAIEPSHRYISASGLVGQAEQAFSTRIAWYRHGGQLVQAPSVPATVPSRIAASVLSVSGLDTTPALLRSGLEPPPRASFLPAPPCSAYYGQLPARYEADGSTPLPTFRAQVPSYVTCGYGPEQLRAAYEGGPHPRLNGQGVTVAITLWYAASHILTDANTYASRRGEPLFARGQFTQVLADKFTDTKQCGNLADEESLDVEAVHNMAPAANIRYYAGASCNEGDMIRALDRVVDENKASIISNSWLEPESDEPSWAVSAMHHVFAQAAMQGISVLFSSGDAGDEQLDSGVKQTDLPASDPLVTAVGGTSLAVGAGRDRLWETGWGGAFYGLSANAHAWTFGGFGGGSGGGYSRLFGRPAYQDGVVPAGHSGRAVPDISLDGDPNTGMLIGLTERFPHGKDRYVELEFGGTSLSSPLLAGDVALAGQATEQRFGLLNPVVYSLPASHPSAIHDIRSRSAAIVFAYYRDGFNARDGVGYELDHFGEDSSLATRPGWDEVTGVGSPAPSFITALAGD